MKNNISKIRKLSLNTIISSREKETLLKYIRVEEGILDCAIERNNLMLEYDLDKTSLYGLVLKIKPLLETAGIKFKVNFLDKLKTEFIYYVENNQRDNFNNPSGWHLRLQNLYLAQANMTELAQENLDIKTPAWKKSLDNDITLSTGKN